MTGQPNSAQLEFDFTVLRARVDRLVDRRRVPAGGAERLLVELVKRGLDEQALKSAALLVATIDDDAARRNGSRAA